MTSIQTRPIVLNSILLVAPFLLLELAIRLGAFAYYGFNPYYLTYGFKSAGLRVTTDVIVYEGYYKFQPNSVVTQGPLSWRRIPSNINNIGLRGVKPISLQKPENAVRIVTLGGSSTFGYHARDLHTYPALLELKLQSRLGDRPVEVINAGIPNFDSDNLVAILEKELLAYKPDVITVYSAFNDAASTLDEKWWQKVSRWLYDHVATYVALSRLVSRVSDTLVYTKWSSYVAAPSTEYVSKQIELHVRKYERNIERIIELGTEHNAVVLLIRQPMAPTHVARKDRLNYDEIVSWQYELLAQGVSLHPKAVMLLVHAALLETLDKLAIKHSLPVVDNVQIVDQRKDRLLTYVHLSEEGNDALASAIAETLLPILQR